MADLSFGERIGSLGNLRLGCSVAVFDQSRERILLMKRSDNGLWCLPSGGMEPGENVAETAVREVAEETGFNVRILGLIGVYSSPDVLVTYADGNRFQIVSLCFEARAVAGQMSVTDEAMELRFVAERELASVDIMKNHVERIHDAFHFDGQTVIR